MENDRDRQSVRNPRLRRGDLSPPLRQIAVLIETATSWGQDVVTGIERFAAKIDWSLAVEPRGPTERLRLPKDWRFDGVIASVANKDLLAELVAGSTPWVDVSWFDHGADEHARCAIDVEATATEAHAYFTDRGFSNFAYCPSMSQTDFSDRLGAAFGKIVVASGGQVHDLGKTEGDEAFSREGITKALARLQRPSAVLTHSVMDGRRLVDIARSIGLRVPHDLAVVGVLEDSRSALMAKPEISAFRSRGNAVGTCAAERLASRIRGETDDEVRAFPPGRIVTRASSDSLAVADPMVAEVCEYIAGNIATLGGIDDLLARVAVSRRTLEHRFQSALGKSPAATIRFIRTQRAYQLLLETSAPITSIAIATGYPRPESMTRAFRAEFGRTPSELRAME